MKEKSNYAYIFIILLLLVIAYWKMGTNFFWRDDWACMYIFKEWGLGYLSQSYAGHFFPLFYIVYCAELYLFGVNADLYHYVNLLAYAGLCFSFFLLCHYTSKNKLLSFVFTFYLLAHPLNFMMVLHTYELCEIIHILFQILFVLYFLKYLENKSPKHLIFSCALLFFQAFFYDNGLLMPLLVIVASWIYNLKKQNGIIFSIIFLMLTFLFLFIHYYFIGKTTLQQSPHMFSLAKIFEDLPLVIWAFIKFASITVSRSFLLFDKLIGETGCIIFSFLFFSFIFYCSYKIKEVRKDMVFALYWMILTCIAIPIVRYKIIFFPYYYSCLSLAPVLYILFIVLKGINEHSSRFLIIEKFKNNFIKYNPAYALTAAIFFILIFIADQHLVNIFEYRNIKNKEAMELAIKNNTAFQPFDDPVISDIKIIACWPHPWEYNGICAREHYLYWQRNSLETQLKKQIVCQIKLN